MITILMNKDNDNMILMNKDNDNMILWIKIMIIWY